MIRQESIQLPFRYAAGETSSVFLEELRETGRLLGSVCAPCQHVACPPQGWCPRCGEPTGELREVGPGGVLVSWTSRTGTGTFGLVRLDGADGAMLHRLVGDMAWQVGQRVQAVRAAQPTGSVCDLEGFGVE